MVKSASSSMETQNSTQIRQRLVDALELDLVGPFPGHQLESESLPQAPSRWYLTGFLVPTGHITPEIDCDENLDQAGSSSGDGDDDEQPERVSGEAKFFPSSIGLSVLVSAETKNLTIDLYWADYQAQQTKSHGEFAEGMDRPNQTGLLPGKEPQPSSWKRTQYHHRFENLIIQNQTKPILVPNSRGLKLVILSRLVRKDSMIGSVPNGTKVVSVFFVNERDIAVESDRDQTFAFQAKVRLTNPMGFVPRPNVQNNAARDADERIADLQYRDSFEYATGHGISTEASLNEQGLCQTIETRWIPTASVERVDTAKIPGILLSMEGLADLADFAASKSALLPLVVQYREWINKQRQFTESLSASRKETLDQLLRGATRIANRIEEGIQGLSDPKVFESFRLANKAMAMSARQRQSLAKMVDPHLVPPPEWRPFQLAFILMNLPGIADPFHVDREVVDLLFFPTGGGKTEAYLGLSAFTLVLRRLKHKDIGYAGVSILMRYTLRLLTLDQLGRAAMLICALEILRKADESKLGSWEFEIGLWVGRTATPNVMGKKNDNNPNSARARTIAFNNQTTSTSPIPLEECPWCGTKFTKDGGASPFILRPNVDEPKDLTIHCFNTKCAFHGRALPIVAVDEPVYRRLPCFVIATVDKFAAMPWTGQVGALFGRVNRVGPDGFYGPTDPPGTQKVLPNSLPPPDLIIQDELHLVSGPMGTMVGLYETTLEHLCLREVDGKLIRPKIVASTATVRRATEQIRALFDRREVDIFPAPGPNRRDSFFAETVPPSKKPPRMYVGIAAQGVSSKKMLHRIYLALLGAGQKSWEEQGGSKNPNNPADPYMTLVGYFNSLRELGSSRRIIEDDVSSMLTAYGRRKRIGEKESPFASRILKGEVTELTSRVDTGKVSETKQRLSKDFSTEEKVDVVVATNMISVGLDITRLGLMVVMGQPKTSAEYIQATSRVGRDENKPGLVITILNAHKHRDLSHFERFRYYHENFYRSVEATSVTPFSPRALDRGLAGAVVGLARLGHSPMTRPLGAMEILKERGFLSFVTEAFAKRAESQNIPGFRTSQEMRDWLVGRVNYLLDEWTKTVDENIKVNVKTQYQIEEGNAARLLFEFLHPELIKKGPRYPFRANRSMRDVEPAVDIWARSFDDRSPMGNE